MPQDVNLMEGRKANPELLETPGAALTWSGNHPLHLRDTKHLSQFQLIPTVLNNTQRNKVTTHRMIYDPLRKLLFI